VPAHIHCDIRRTDHTTQHADHACPDTVNSLAERHSDQKLHLACRPDVRRDFRTRKWLSLLVLVLGVDTKGLGA
jgi:hypothetical protein